MIDEIRYFIRKTATSRKFWAAVAASLPLALAHNWHDFALVWIGYAGIQGAVDACASLPSKAPKD